MSLGILYTVKSSERASSIYPFSAVISAVINVWYKKYGTSLRVHVLTSSQTLEFLAFEQAPLGALVVSLPIPGPKGPQESLFKGYKVCSRSHCSLYSFPTVVRTVNKLPGGLWGYPCPSLSIPGPKGPKRACSKAIRFAAGHIAHCILFLQWCELWTSFLGGSGGIPAHPCPSPVPRALKRACSKAVRFAAGHIAHCILSLQWCELVERRKQSRHWSLSFKFCDIWFVRAWKP